MQTRSHFTTALRNFLGGKLKISSTTGHFLNRGQQVTTGYPVLIYLLINWQINVTQSGVLIRCSVRAVPICWELRAGWSDKNSGGGKPRPEPGERREGAGRVGIKSGGGTSHKERGAGCDDTGCRDKTRVRDVSWAEPPRDQFSVATRCQQR